MKKYTKMTEDELAEERARLDAQMQELRAQKKAIQDEVDRRLTEAETASSHTISDAGGIESQEKVGDNG